MIKRKTYTQLVFGITLAITGAVGAFNYIVNPLGLYNTPVIAGFNDRHPAATGFTRLYKTEDVKRLKPDVVITGTSRADSGLNPKAAEFGDARVYNFAMPAASINEQRHALEFAQAVHPLKTAIITLDFFAFNARKLENKQFDTARYDGPSLEQPRAFFETYGTLLALDTVVASFKHMRYIKKPDRYGYALANGYKVSNDMAYDIAQHGAAKQFLSPGNENEISVADFDFNYSAKSGDDTFRHFESMLDFTRRNGINVILFISPVHETYLRKLEAEGKAALAEQWKKRLEKIVRANAAKYHGAAYPLWDFAYRNSITTEPLPPENDKKSRMRWFWDSNHYKEATGDIVLRRVLGMNVDKAYDDFGRKLVE
jgi:hypothetical protein